MIEQKTDAERQVPVDIWNTASFQEWYSLLLEAGNRLDGVKPVMEFRAGPNGKFVIFWGLHVNIFVAKEKRNKGNEVIFGRASTSYIVLYRGDEVVLVKEFRSPVANKEGFVYELPGGSSFKPNQDPAEVASNEVHEEVGVKIDPKRFKYHVVRQACAIMSTHRVHLFSVKPTWGEMRKIKRMERDDVVNGEEGSSEKTYLCVRKITDIMKSDGVPVDFGTLGMITQVL